jgi:glyoxylase-like metal-dependent hydrolase (beta-lactamase superfamily II)
MLCGLTLALCAQAPLVTPMRTELAPGIFLFSRAGYGDVGLDGNSIAVISRDGVLVFDTNGTPAASAAVLAQIRTLTDQPVKWIVNSHWHWDHWYGTETYQRAFPTVRVVSHETNRQLMSGPALEFNKPFLEQQLPAYLQSVEKRAEEKDEAVVAISRQYGKEYFDGERKYGYGGYRYDGHPGGKSSQRRR